MCTFSQNLRTRLRSFCKILHGGLRRIGRFSTQENIQFCHVGNYLYFCIVLWLCHNFTYVCCIFAIGIKQILLWNQLFYKKLLMKMC